jgi:hypothetical protein
MTTPNKHTVTGRADGFGNRDCSCGGTWKDGEATCSTLKPATTPNKTKDIDDAIWTGLAIAGYRVKELEDSGSFVDVEEHVKIRVISVREVLEKRGLV